MPRLRGLLGSPTHDEAARTVIPTTCSAARLAPDAQASALAALSAVAGQRTSCVSVAGATTSQDIAGRPYDVAVSW
jgi:hypothetical protein